MGAIPKIEVKSDPGKPFKPLEPANDNTGVRLLSFEEYKAKKFGTADALIKGLVRTGTLIAVGGRPGAGKTALMVAIADALDKGEPFLGRETKETIVAYIAAEDGGDVANRLEAIGNTSIKIVDSPDGFPLTKPQRAAAIARDVVRQAKALDPDRHVLLVVDTLRAALGGQSVLDDKYTSPALNALREIAESEGVVIAVLNHTNRENNKATKGETLEAVTALELVLLDGEGDWHTVYVGKNRSGPGHRNIGKVRYTSVQIGDVTAAIIEEMVADESVVATQEKERRPSDNARMLREIILTAVLDSRDYIHPFGNDGPRVKAAQISDIRAKFYSRKEGLEDTKKKAFTRALNHWLDKQWIVRGSFGVEGAVWLAKNEASGASERPGGQDTTPT
ncbi:AAA family ATPase [Bradyrhizobium japonicum]|uniref:AAA family ATPase n=2 Tax=Bradyrhizobium japonicum TaxID=375 RepID=UPI001E2F42ED|nr:AAA family ATPase [Bradyrhizobium japonicum]MCD9898118.1 AAA family ATPase [Bradyrhizobium japonicum]WLB28487.1 AAA family ATPase [Bradyrhizobium japonicum]WRJ84759.1 AAA family ATPase [Bradyrhizobium japonicum]WRJ93729.1 AAA family ATPase [Bradyrhizobium japonicum]WRK47581.1 AAA family ATPase [Bradyrhizobium japonicum]